MDIFWSDKTDFKYLSFPVLPDFNFKLWKWYEFNQFLTDFFNNMGQLIWILLDMTSRIMWAACQKQLQYVLLAKFPC